MPAPQALLFKQAARLKFTSFNIKVPPNWKQPQGEDAEHYDAAFKPSEKTTTPGMPPLFQPASLNKYHTDSQKMLIAKFGEFIDTTCDAICGAWAQWQSMATMAGIIVNAVTASGGQLIGPPWQPLIMMQGAKNSPMALKYTNVIATVLSTAWMTYTATIKLPGLPFYPAFASFPLAMAPPTPNIPHSLAMLTQVPASLSPPLLKQQMVAMLADPQAPYSGQLFEAIIDGFDKMFQVWNKTTMVTNVLGFGAVPTWTPVSPVGPVVGGVATMAPGGLV